MFLIALLAIVSQSLRQFGLCSEKAAPLRAAAINPVRVSEDATRVSHFLPCLKPRVSSAAVTPASWRASAAMTAATWSTASLGKLGLMAFSADGACASSPKSASSCFFSASGASAQWAKFDLNETRTSASLPRMVALKARQKLAEMGWQENRVRRLRKRLETSLSQMPSEPNKTSSTHSSVTSAMS